MRVVLQPELTAQADLVPPASGIRTPGWRLMGFRSPGRSTWVPFADFRSVMKACQPSSSTRAWIRDTTPEESATRSGRARPSATALSRVGSRPMT